MDKFRKQVNHLIENEKINPAKILFGKDEKGQDACVFFDTNYLYIKTESTFEKVLREQGISTKFISGAPEGALLIQTPELTLSLHEIHEGRVYDFTQTLDPKSIYKASYNATEPLQNSVLTNPEHAELIDQLRYELQTGQISQHDYDSLNPVLPKAGK
ncbi:DUF5449 family protein [Fructobacillus sp. M2-14]|uniref:DUF5449 family protein n=1 Tax=Fructobacillus broussonetiae TaxID=2713173 RepID=A0ABS5QXZ8_9LACO|nr:histidine decarboxylase maturation protein HdcB [Fructobacillus broussonetiae]MBS9338076.1 DUF5449 family protein [Fructobacillus broussonetiae]